MIRNSVMILMTAAAALYAALGSGPFVRTGFGWYGFYGTALDLKLGAERYVPLECDPDDSMCHFDWYDGKSDANKKTTVAPAFTVGYEYSFARALSVSGGLGLSFAGMTFTEVPLEANRVLVNKGTIDGRLRMTFITLPIEAKLMLPLNSGGFHISFGPTFSYIASATFDNRVMSKKFNERDLYGPLAVSLGGSLGGEVFLFKDFDLLYGIRGDIGVTDIAKADDIKLSPASFAFEAGLRWTIDRHEKSKKWPL